MADRKSLGSLAWFKFRLFSAHHTCKVCFWNEPRNCINEHLDTAICDSAHGEFLVPRNTEFAHQNHVKLQMQDLRNLKCYWPIAGAPIFADQTKPCNGDTEWRARPCFTERPPSF